MAAADSPPSRGIPHTAGRSLNIFPRRAEAQFELAQRYADGNGVRKDPYLAAAWAQVAAHAHSAPAREWLKAQAEAGNVFAQLYYGELLRSGLASEPDNAKAAGSWFAKAIPTLREAAGREDAQAEVALAFAYLDGLGVPLDAANARALVQQAATKFYAPALNQVGTMMLQGIGGQKDLEKGLQFIEGAASLGFVKAQQNLGIVYRQGQFVPKDSARAAQWFRLAALAGDAESEFQLGRMLEQGEGLVRDYPGAIEMYRLAADQGSPEAANNLGTLIQAGHGTPAAPADALGWFKLAAAAGDAFGEYNEGLAYRDGLGVPLDLDQAQVWLGKAAKAGHDAAKRALTRLSGLRACRKGGHLTALFENPIRCVTRDAFRQAVARAGGTPKRENDNYWYDIYDSATLLEGTSELQVGYTTENDEFARAVYIFPSSSDRKQVLNVAEMVAVKYGRPIRQSGQTEVGEVSFEWNLPDGIQLRVSRDWPDMTTYLEYVSPDRFAQLKREVSAAEIREKIAKSRSQSGAF